MLRVGIGNCITICRMENHWFNPVNLLRQFTFPNPKYFQNERLGFSNYGTAKQICLAELNDNIITMPRGLAADILRHCPGAEIIDETVVNPVRFSSSCVELRDYQRNALDSILQKNQGILVSPPGSGKTVVGIELIIRRGQRALVLVHTLDLLKQWHERLRHFTGIEPGVIQGDRFDTRNITIGMVQSLSRPLDDSFKNQFGLVLLDEAHHAPAATFQQLIDQFPARYRYGLTATPERQDGLDFLMTAFMGPVVHKVENGILIGNGSILKPAVTAVHTSSYIPFIKSYQELLEKLVKDESRNRMIIDLVENQAKAGHYILVLSERVRHTKELHRLFMDRNPDVKSFVITGKDTKERRRVAIDAMNSGIGRVLFATKIADEGLDIQRLDRLFLTCPVRAAGKVKQQIGRIQRTFPGKQDAVVYDFVDINSLAESQFRTREQRIYSDYQVEHIRASAYGKNSNHDEAA